MAEPMTRLLPVVGSLRYETAALPNHIDNIAQILARRGAISAKIPPAPGDGPGAVAKEHIFDVVQKKWIPEPAAPHGNLVTAIDEAVTWFNAESEAVTDAHRLITKLAPGYRLSQTPPLAKAHRDWRDRWRAIHQWLQQELKPEPGIAASGTGSDEVFEAIADSLSLMSRPVPMRLSLCAAAIEDVISLQLTVPEMMGHSQHFLARHGVLIESDSNRRIDAGRHRRAVILSQALAVVCGFGLFLSAPETRFHFRVIMGDPDADFPSEGYGEIHVGLGDFMGTLQTIETCKAQELETVSGVAVSGKF